MMKWLVLPDAPPQSPSLAELLAPYSTRGRLDFALATVDRGLAARIVLSPLRPWRTMQP
jgi:hypothetical protein